MKRLPCSGGMLRTVAVLAISIVFLLASTAGASPVHVSACGTTTVADLVGTTCTIGDQMFSFTGFGEQENLDPALITFTPDVNHPWDINFSLSSPEFSVETTEIQQPWDVSYGQLFFTISALPGSLYIGSFDVSVNAVTMIDPVIRENRSPGAWGAGFLHLGTGGNYPDPCDALGMVGINIDGPVLIDRSCGGILSDTTSGYAYFGVSAGGGIASASMSSVTYTLHRQPTRPVSEPSVFLLFSAGVGFCVLRLAVRLSEPSSR